MAEGGLVRFSLKWFLFAVAFAALAIATLLRPDEWLRVLFTGVVWLLITYAALVIITVRDERRVFAAGFLVVGLPYGLMSSYPPSKSSPGPQRPIEEFIAKPVHRLLVPTLASRRATPGFIIEPEPEDRNLLLIGPRRVYDMRSELPTTTSTVHAAFTIVLGCIGGGVAVSMHRRTERRELVGAQGPSSANLPK
jgi:hypothetical protein